MESSAGFTGVMGNLENLANGIGKFLLIEWLGENPLNTKFFSHIKIKGFTPADGNNVQSREVVFGFED
jgi:hypothetical protein